MSITDKIVKRFESDKTFAFSELDPFSEVSSWISTGSPYFDYKLLTLGFPTGIIEVRGESQSGKTTTSLHVMKQTVTQYKERAVVTILSSERRDNKIYAMQLGLDVDSVIIHRVRTIEDTINKIHQTVTQAYDSLNDDLVEQVSKENPKLKKGADAFKAKVAEARKEFGKLRFLFVWDSLGQTLSQQELKKTEARAEKNETGQAAMASAARALSFGLRGIVGMTDEEDVTLLIINRPYDKIDENTGAAGGKKSYGGKAIELYPSMRIELTKIEGCKVKGSEGKDIEIGQITEVNPHKTDFGVPKQKFKVEIGYGYGYVLCKGDLELGIEAGFMKKFGNGGGIFYQGNKELLRWESRQDLYDLYENQSPMLKILTQKLLKYVHDKVLRERKEKIESLKK